MPRTPPHIVRARRLACISAANLAKADQLAAMVRDMPQPANHMASPDPITDALVDAHLDQIEADIAATDAINVTAPEPLDDMIRRQIVADELAANKLRRLHEAGMAPKRRGDTLLAMIALVLITTLGFLAVVYGIFGAAVVVLWVGGAA